MIGLTDRQKRILEFIVKEYIETAEPVGSRTISQNKELGISAATVRNEMSDLERIGLLLQPHASAGRIPSPEAFEFYARDLLQTGSIEYPEYENLTEIFENVSQITTLIDKSLNLLTQMTNYPAVAISQRTIKKQTIRRIDIIRLSAEEAVIVIVVESGEVKSAVTHISGELTEDALRAITEQMNARMRGLDITDLTGSVLELIKQSLSEYAQEFELLTSELQEAFDQEENIELALIGATNMLNYPEFHSIEKAKSFMEFLSQKKEVQKLFDTEGISKDDINIVIGNENMGEVARDVSIISANINYEGAVVGKIGIIAPRRMDYNKACAIVSFIQSQINSILNDS